VAVIWRSKLLLIFNQTTVQTTSLSSRGHHQSLWWPCVVGERGDAMNYGIAASPENIWCSIECT